MKYTQIFSIALVAFALVLGACSGKKDSDVRDEARESLGLENTQDPPSQAVVPFSPDALTSTNVVPPAGGVQHYTCPDNCEGSGGAGAGTCPVCGKEYVHNQAWHAQNNAATTGTDPANPATIQPPANATPPAAQNAAGVYHYTCPSGCAGGAGGAGACASCGAALAHNAAYHQ